MTTAAASTMPKLSQYVEPHHAMQLLEDGGRGVGYLLKDRVADVQEVTEAVRRVAAGGSVIDPEVVAQLVGRRRTRDPTTTAASWPCSRSCGPRPAPAGARTRSGTSAARRPAG
jgi:DNA-binding NarL/FixJ family response regulator